MEDLEKVEVDLFFPNIVEIEMLNPTIKTLFRQQFLKGMVEKIKKNPLPQSWLRLIQMSLKVRTGVP